MTDPTTPEIAVTQEDKERAAAALGWTSYGAGMDLGTPADRSTLRTAAERLARHRIASTRTPPDGEVGELIERLRRMKSEADELSIFNILVNPDGPEAADTLTAYRDKVERLEEVVEFYADPENWHGVYMCGRGPMTDDWSDVEHPNYPDGKPGALARSALTDPPNLPPGD